MQQVIIYTKSYCPYCVKAKALLDKKGAAYKEINAEEDNHFKEMLQKSNGMKTVPQIFIGNTHVGGCDNLYALDKEGKLDPMLR